MYIYIYSVDPRQSRDIPQWGRNTHYKVMVRVRVRVNPNPYRVNHFMHILDKGNLSFILRFVTCM